MTAPTALRIRKRPRGARMLGAALLTAGIVIGGGTASVGTAQAADIVCHDPLLGGSFFCDPSVGPSSGEAWWTFPNGTKQLFVIGTNNAVWTRWDNTSGNWSSWTSMGGIAISFPPRFYINGAFQQNGGGTYTPDLTVIGADHGVWHRTRGGDGVWDAWTAGY